jgi:outer membrane receptor protein involved in Fe transport
MDPINRNWFSPALCLAVLAMSTAPLAAQETTAPSTPPAAPTSEETITLSPFQVSSESDTGYVATNTLAGSRINTSLLDTPASISVMTKEFMDDIGALDLKGAMEYAVNGGSHAGDVTGISLIENAFNFQIRGYRDTTVTRNYFTTDVPGDTFNMDRIDVARGPNSILFGIGGPGGVVNYSTKQASTERRDGSVNVVVGRWDLQRAGLDYNLPLVAHKLGARLNLMTQRAEGYYDFEEDDQDRGALDVVWTPTKTTTVRVGGEYGDLHQNRARPFLPYDMMRVWKIWGSHTVAFGTPQSPGSIPGDDYFSQTNGSPPDPATGVGMNRTGAHVIGNKHQFGWLAIMDGPLAGKVIYNGLASEANRWYRTSANDNQPGFNTPAQVDDESIFPRHGNIAGPGQFTDTTYSDISITIDQSVGRNLNLQLAANRSEQDLHRQRVQAYGQNYLFYDVTSTLPTFTAGGLYDGTVGSSAGAALAAKLGIPYVPTTQGRGALNLNRAIANPNVGKLMAYADPAYNDSEGTTDDLRFTANYHLDLGKFGDHMVLGMLTRTESEWEGQNYSLGNVHPQRKEPYHFNGVLPHIYHIDPFSPNLADHGVPDIFAPGALIAAQNVLGIPGEFYQDGFVRDGWSWWRSVNESATVALQSRFFSNQLVLTGGFRRDTIKNWDGSDIPNTNEDTGEVTGVTRSSTPSIDVSDDTYSVGAVLHVPKVEWLSVFANASTNFRAQGDVELFEDEALRPNYKLGPLTGEGFDYGLKFTFLNGKVNATLTHFDVSQDGANAGSLDGNVFNYIDAIWTTIKNNGPDTVVTDADDPNGHHFGGVDSRSQKSEGYEFELTANPTPNWRVSFNISKTDNTISNVGGALAAYMDKHRAEWQSKAALGYDSSRSPGNLSNAGGSNTIGALITGLDEILGYAQSEEGQIEVNSRPWNANAFTAYDFTEGRLKGLTLGAGVNYRGEAVLGVKPAETSTDHSEMFMGGDYYLFNAMAAYRFKIGRKFDVKIQVNVDNLFDNDDKQVLASAWNPNAHALETQYYFFRPRSYKLSATFEF